MLPIKVQFTSQEAKELYNGELKYASEGSSGFDLRAVSFDTSFDKLGAIHNIDKNWQEDTPPPIIGYTLFSGRRILIKTGIKIALPKPETFLTATTVYHGDPKNRETIWAGRRVLQYELQIRPRSGLALKHGISIVNTPGTVDSDYTGEIGVILINHGSEPFEIKLGDRIAQGIICPVVKGQFEYVDSLETSERGEGGFGSSGVK